MGAKTGSCGRPPFPIRGFRTGARQRIWRSQVCTLSYTKQKGGHEALLSRDNLDENGGGNQSLKRRPVAEL